MPTPTKTSAAPPIRGMIGSHLSVAGGAHLAIEGAIALGLDCVQIFTRNQRQWSAPPLDPAAVATFRAARTAAGWDDLTQRVVSHNSYLCNLASPDDALRERSIQLQRDELERCEALGVTRCVIHPGAHLGAPRVPKSPNPLRAPPGRDEAAGLARIARSLDAIHRSLKGYRVVTCLETTTGSGTNLGYDFAHLATIRSLVAEPERIGYCLDTCHVASAGYLVATAAESAATLEEFDAICGKRDLLVLHMNDSKAPAGSRLDRHEHIADGTCGIDWFRAILRDPDLVLVPKILETAKENDASGRAWDEVNAARLRELLVAAPEPRAAVAPKRSSAPRGSGAAKRSKG